MPSVLEFHESWDKDWFASLVNKESVQKSFKFLGGEKINIFLVGNLVGIIPFLGIYCDCLVLEDEISF